MDGRFPVSVKGVILTEGRVVLLRNERGEWELPGGRMEHGETPEGCVAREILEELDLHAEVGPLLDAWVYEPLPGRDVIILAYGCFVRDLGPIKHSPEHSAMGLFGLAELDGIPLPSGYAQAARIWSGHPVGPGARGA